MNKKDEVEEVLDQWRSNGTVSVYDLLKACGKIHAGGKATSFGDHISHLHSEVSEVYEEFRKGNSYNHIYSKGNKPEGIPIELADVILKTLAICSHYDIDISHALVMKLEYNASKRKKKSKDDPHG